MGMKYEYDDADRAAIFPPTSAPVGSEVWVMDRSGRRRGGTHRRASDAGRSMSARRVWRHVLPTLRRRCEAVRGAVVNVARVLVDGFRQAGLLFASMAQPVNPDELIRPGEAAALCGVSVRTLSRYVGEGRLTAIRTVGGHFRYRRADIVAIATPTAAA